MTEHSNQVYAGIPRSEIAWFPTLNLERCDGCGECVRHCKHDVFAVVDEKPVVAKPENCVVGCKACGWICPIGAITHPSKDKLREMMKHARLKYGFSLVQTDKR
ncbi:MAG: 4Fe-4S dicluster domain-containing protein [Candidatus Bathyarchaeia archaeon]|nr:4Fe-4S binding protein [Candidatus Bathyarchaeota archaeon A05DMB-4]MDH7594667.1 4Fe-4S binding protein [Candidatus Bathyarchaeota archaeon]